jgi:hypothetical protein
MESDSESQGAPESESSDGSLRQILWVHIPSHTIGTWTIYLLVASEACNLGLASIIWLTVRTLGLFALGSKKNGVFLMTIQSSELLIIGS